MCRFLQRDTCLVATELSGIVVHPTSDQCHMCSIHPSLPQGINSVTCSMARSKQVEAGLEPDSDLFECIKNDQLPISKEKLEASHAWWNKLHSLCLSPWSPKFAESYFKELCKTIPEYGCNCKDDFEEIVLYYPIMFDTYFNYFVSAWYVHNLVNTKLFKPWFLLKDAMIKYNYKEKYIG